MPSPAQSAVAGVAPLLAMLALLVWPQQAKACKEGREAETSLTRPDVPFGNPQPEGLTAGPDRVWVSCAGTRNTPECTWATEHVFRSGGRPVHQRLFFFGGDPGALQVFVDGVRVDAASPTGSDEARTFTQPVMSDEVARVIMSSFVLDLPADAQATVRIETVTHPAVDVGYCGLDPMRLRHPLVSRDFSTRDTRVAFARSPERSKDPDAYLDFTYRAKGIWTTPRWAAGRSVGRRTRNIHYGPDEPRAFVGISTHGAVHPGGPFVGLGASFSDRTRLRLRGGWEFAAPHLLVWGLTVETDTKRSVELIPGVEVSMPWGQVLSLFPAPSAGFAVPVEVLAGVRAGLRAQLSLSWRVFSIVGTYDDFPARNGAPRVRRGGIVGQLSM